MTHFRGTARCSNQPATPPCERIVRSVPLKSLYGCPGRIAVTVKVELGAVSGGSAKLLAGSLPPERAQELRGNPSSHPRHNAGDEPPQESAPWLPSVWPHREGLRL